MQNKPQPNEPELDISIIIACYNERPVLRDSVTRIVDVMNGSKYARSYELIFVDDVSRDNTVDIILELMEKYRDIPMRLIRHERNKGRGRTVMDGFEAARGRIMGFLDIDLETPAHYIPVAILEIERGAEVATALRVYKFLWRTFYRQVLSVGYHRLVAAVLRVPLKDTEVGFKFFNRERALPVLLECKDPGWFWDTEVMTRSYFSGLKIVEIPTLFIKRYDKQSSVRPLHDSLEYFRKLRHFQREAHRLEVEYRSRGLRPLEVQTISHPVGHGDEPQAEELVASTKTAPTL
ncbi:MAG TPA: glycosyltransferase [Chloroflexia bacterium]|nr:glycosyltransferase [Chloroflexia bacterium]